MKAKNIISHTALRDDKQGVKAEFEALTP